MPREWLNKLPWFSLQSHSSQFTVLKHVWDAGSPCHTQGKKKSVKLESKKKHRVESLYFYTFHTLLTWAAKDQWTIASWDGGGGVLDINVNG